jgi:hypothetical protein
MAAVMFEILRGYAMAGFGQDVRAVKAASGGRPKP